MTSTAGIAGLRWDPYLVRRGLEFDDYWKEYLHDDTRNLLYVLGRGFDPRMCTGLRAVLSSAGRGLRDCVLIAFDEGNESPSLRHSFLLEKNMKLLEELLNGRGQLCSKPVQMWSGEERTRHRIGSRRAAEVFTAIADFKSYTDIVIDVSAMPRGIYFPLIGKVLHLLDLAREEGSDSCVPNLHVVVSEDAELDHKIRDIGIDDSAAYVDGFGNLDMEATAENPKIWIVILGEGQRDQLERINALVDPVEICPVLPSPSMNPRRGDQLLRELRELLFDQWRIEPKNIINAAEQNPFEAYRQIHRTARHYNEALAPLGGCKVAISAVSSKLLSIGALLAAYELKRVGMIVGIAHVEAQGYEIIGGGNQEVMAGREELFLLSLAGDCYEP